MRHSRDARASPAVAVALAHIDAWSRHDWDATRALLAPDVHAVVTTTQHDHGVSEFSGVDRYMVRKRTAAQLIEPGSVEVLSVIGDARDALVTMRMRVGLGPGGTMVTMASACLYGLDENEKIRQERDQFFILSE